MAKGSDKVVIHTDKEIVGIRAAAQVTATVLAKLCAAVRPGMSTAELDLLAGSYIAELGGTSAFYKYHGFPGQICISLNDEIIHGIGRPDRIIKLGDLVSIDTGVKYRGYIGDTARTVSIGPATGVAARLLEVTERSLMAGIAAATCGNTVRDIGEAVYEVVRSAGFDVVRDFVGHGVGVSLHEPPEVPNYPSVHAKQKLRPGMVLAIEPMVNVGSGDVSRDRDNWTARTRDGSLSAHFEHSILITDHQAEILTWQKTV